MTEAGSHAHCGVWLVSVLCEQIFLDTVPFQGGNFPLEKSLQHSFVLFSKSFLGYQDEGIGSHKSGQCVACSWGADPCGGAALLMA